MKQLAPSMKSSLVATPVNGLRSQMKKFSRLIEGGVQMNNTNPCDKCAMKAFCSGAKAENCTILYRYLHGIQF